MKLAPANRLSLRRMLILMIGILTLLSVTLAASAFGKSAERVGDLKALERATDLTNQVFMASESLIMERDVTLSLLSARDSADAGTIPDLDDARQRADSARFWALAALETRDGPALARWRPHISSAAQELNTLRGLVDAALAGRGDDHAALAARWREATDVQLANLDALWADCIRPYVNIDPIITQNFRYNHFLRVILDYSGRERALIGELIGANASATPFQAAELFRGDGVLQTSWRMSLLLAQQSGLYARIEPAYLDARSHTDMLHAMLAETFYTPGSQDARRFPISLPLWLELSQQARESLYALRASARAGMLERVHALAAESQRAMIWQGALLLFALLLCAANIWAVLDRVIKPIDAIIAALIKTTRGETATFPQRRTSDEIGQLVEVLHAFQAKVDDVRQSAADLDQSERRLRSIVDNAVDGVLTLDASGVIETFNPACEHIFGWTAEEAVGAHISALIQPSQHDAHHDHWARRLGFGDERMMGTTRRELLARRKDGALFSLDLSLSTFVLAEGRRFSGIVRDITMRKEAESALLAHTSALERSNKELDDFAYIASHDLKEPLRGIHNHSRFLLEDNEGKLDEDSIRRLYRLVYLSQRMEQLVNDLLYFSRLGRHEFAIQATDLNEVVIDIESTLEHFLTENGARIVLENPLPIIRCDKTRVTEMLRNLITNAVKYNDKEDKRIEIGVSPHKQAPNGDVAERVFYVADNGCGIAPEFHEEVFRIFKRLHARSSEQDGTGVGLTFVKKIVERHGGRIWIESKPGAGATFNFTLETSDGTAIDNRAAA